MSILLVLTFSEATSRELLKVTQKDKTIVKISKGKSSCSVSFWKSASADYETTCKEMTNSKGVKIFCTTDKHICKTLGEVSYFNYTEKTLPKNLHQNIPSLGKTGFNFMGGSGTWGNFSILKNGQIKFLLIGTMSTGVTYKGDINSPSNPYWIHGDIICNKDKNIIGLCTKLVIY